uniref:Uncharacterized protein MANES_01G248400 n=1 Tax=Rhizophora mucronata TaxID=61149 RepID=A0A2P2Q3Q2_RHIMU
MLPGSKERL